MEARMVNSIGGAIFPAPSALSRDTAKDANKILPTDTAQAALAKLRQPRQPTEAESKLDEILQSLKQSAKSGKSDAARRKLEQIKARIKALQMAAVAAGAAGDPKAAKNLARDVKQLARDLANAIRDAGQSHGAVGLVVPSVANLAAGAKPQALAEALGGTLAEGRKADAAAVAAALIKGAVTANAQSPAVADARDEAAQKQALEGVKSEARSLIKEMKKLLIAARFALLNPAANQDERRKADFAFGEADQALAELNAATAPSRGGIDLRA
jgi:hypothetical protein